MIGLPDVTGIKRAIIGTTGDVKISKMIAKHISKIRLPTTFTPSSLGPVRLCAGLASQAHSSDIPQMGSVGMHKPAPPSGCGQSGARPRADLSQQQASERKSWAHLGWTDRARLSCARRGLLASCRHIILSPHVAATGEPRSRSIRRRISAKSALGTATSASWKMA